MVTGECLWGVAGVGERWVFTHLSFSSPHTHFPPTLPTHAPLSLGEAEMEVARIWRSKGVYV